MLMAKVTLTCKGCSCIFEVNYKLRKQKYCSRDCINQSFVGSGNPSFGKVYRTKETHPEWAEKISKTSTEREINSGDKNGMKKPDVAKRQGQTRSHKFATDPSWKERYSKPMRDAWASGKYENVPVGRCKWYVHIKPDNSTVKLQGTWEVVFARHMDRLNIEYESHRGTIKYFYRGVERSYYPDFYIPAMNVYVDVKGAFFNELQRDKFSSIKECNPNIEIYLVTKEVFRDLGIDIQRESTSLNVDQSII
jgi:hypothetical protein